MMVIVRSNGYGYSCSNKLLTKKNNIRNYCYWAPCNSGKSKGYIGWVNSSLSSVLPRCWCEYILARVDFSSIDHRRNVVKKHNFTGRLCLNIFSDKLIYGPDWFEDTIIYNPVNEIVWVLTQRFNWITEEQRGDLQIITSKV